MEIKHEHVEMVLLAWAAEVGQAFAANAIAEEYARIGGDQLRLVPGKTWSNQQNIFHRWLKGETEQQREKSACCFRQSCAFSRVKSVTA
jgi:hypothetical protein